ncbi:hypothetical protein [uncultured Chryseobacterium sp.]|uniref:hypothetical protein n=1 Tax=uncultured Chryseobacterium sp. TaxID=259322 RepID=UPI0025F641E3|nr:hypothetical protein [uncultured Chryseobacterium sp.]
MKKPKQTKKLHLSRSQEAIRKLKVYEDYNQNAQEKINSGILLTDFKNQLAKKYSYKNYQTIANLISRLDNKRRAEIVKNLNLIAKPVFLSMPGNKTGEAESTVGLIAGDFKFNIFVRIKFDEFPQDDGSYDFGIRETEISLNDAYQGDKHLYLSRTDKKYIEDFYSKNLYFDLVSE